MQYACMQQPRARDHSRDSLVHGSPRGQRGARAAGSVPQSLNTCARAPPPPFCSSRGCEIGVVLTAVQHAAAGLSLFGSVLIRILVRD